jgi:hypothetical protein
VSEVEAAVERAEVLRTWPMRGTLHFVAADDARWLLGATGRRHLDRVGKRWDYLGLDAATAERAMTLLDEALSGTPLPRSQMLQRLQDGGVDISGQRGYHLLWFAAQSGLSCVGPNRDGEQTFVRLAAWAPQQRDLSGADAMAELALRYFRSHGPTTRQDFAGWAGITATEARAGIAGAGESLAAGRTDDGAEVWFASDLPDRAGTVLSGDVGRQLLALPGFDEFILGYKDRALQVPAEHADAIVPGGNGVFRATLVDDGRVVGTWKRTLKRDRVLIEPEIFGRPTARLRAAADAAFDDYGRYLGLTPQVRWTA